MSYHNPKERSEEFLAEVRYKWRLNDLGQLVVNNKYPKSGEVGSVCKFTPSSDGYIGMGIQGFSFRQHHVVWYLHTGEWPRQQLDHIDGNRGNNHPKNLRPSSTKMNQRSYNKPSEGTSSKYRGVYSTGRVGKWGSKIKVDGKAYHLGTFTCEKEAALAYNYGALKHGYSPEALNQVFADDDEVT